jgi:cobalt-zinc-cadmium efflux system membrane fusion protein
MHEKASNPMSAKSSTRDRWRPLTVLTMVAIVGVGLWGCGSSSSNRAATTPEKKEQPAGGKEEAKEATGGAAEIRVEPDMQRSVGLIVQRAEQRAVAETIRTTAVVGPDETRSSRIRPLAEGRVLQVLVRAGDRVSAGQTLLVYDSITAGQLTADYRTAAAALERASAEAEVTRRALERADNLVELGGVARADRERRAAELQRAEAEVNGARAGVTNLAQKLRRLGVSDDQLARVQRGEDVNVAARSTVTAPFAGTVLQVTTAPGETITPDRELLTVADLSRVWVQADVYQKDIAKIRVGQNAVVTVDTYAGETFTGRITSISDTLDPTTRTAKVRCEVPNRDGRLKVQMFATLELPVSVTHDAVTVPARAIQDIDGVPTVFVRVDEERFQARPVRIGPSVAGQVEVVEGLKSTDAVVTDGALMLKSKLKLRVDAEEGEEKKK